MEVGEADTCPIGTEEPVIDPGNQGHGDDADAPLTEVYDPPVPLLLEDHHHEPDAGDGQQHQTESVHSLDRKCQFEPPSSVCMALTGCINPIRLTMRANKMKKWENFLRPSI